MLAMPSTYTKTCCYVVVGECAIQKAEPVRDSALKSGATRRKSGCLLTWIGDTKVEVPYIYVVSASSFIELQRRNR